MNLLSFVLILLALTGCARAQVGPSQSVGSIPVSLRFVATRARETTGSSTFFLTGGAADAALPLAGRLSGAIEISGTSTSTVPGTSRGLSTISLLAGPRYTQPLRLANVSGQALFGAVHGFDAAFTTGTGPTDTATSFAFAAGGFVDLPIAHSLTLRPVQIDYLQTRLPNGADNRQGNIRFSGGVVFRIALPARR